MDAGDLTESAGPLAFGERERLTEALRHHFQHTTFRPGQAEVVSAILRGESVLAVMPTGFPGQAPQASGELHLEDEKWIPDER